MWKLQAFPGRLSRSYENMNRAANRVRFMKDHGYEDEPYFHSEDSDGECYPNYVMITENDQLELTTFTVEAQNCAVLDTACGSTVCGQQWFSTYMDSMGRDQVSLEHPGGLNTFKFGAGPIIPSLGTNQNGWDTDTVVDRWGWLWYSTTAFEEGYEETWCGLQYEQRHSCDIRQVSPTQHNYIWPLLCSHS